MDDRESIFVFEGITRLKRWVPVEDQHTRVSLAAMAGVNPTGLDADFSVGGELLARPGDPSQPPRMLSIADAWHLRLMAIPMSERSPEFYESTAELASALGMVMLSWPTYEIQLFELFKALLRAPRERCQVVWFASTSLDMRLRLMNSLAEHMLEGTKKDEVLGAISKSRTLNQRRNQLTHWAWVPDEDGWRIFKATNVNGGVAIGVDVVQQFLNDLDESSNLINDLADWVEACEDMLQG